MGVPGFLWACLGLLAPRWKQALLILLTIFPEVALETIQPLFLMLLIDRAIAPGNYQLLIIIISALFGLLLAYALSRLANLYFTTLVGAKVLNSLRLKVFEVLQNLTASFYNRRKTGDILSRFSSDLDAVDNAIVIELPFAVSCILTIVVGSILMIIIEWRIAMPILVLLPIINLGPRLLGPRTNKANYRRQQDAAMVLSMVEEDIAAQSVIKVFALQKLMVDRFKVGLEQLFRSTIRASLLGGIQGATMTASGHSMLILAIAVGAFLAVRRDLSIGALVAIFELLWFVTSSVQELAGVFPQLQRAAAGWYRINELLDEEPEVVDAEDATPLPPFSREILFQDVSFSYTGSGDNLNGINVTIPVRQSIAIVGRSGSGKSTMLKLLMRFHDPDQGKITIDGHDLRKVTQTSLRSQIGVVFQESFLFNTNIRENIRLGRQNASDEEVLVAAKGAEIHEAILALPHGYDTFVGEKGSCLSGGERQRIALARALIRKPAILILDEPASALDPQTEAAIHVTLARAAKDRTVISVTHRLAPTVNADLILVLENGRVVEQGLHRELLESGSFYSRLWEQQSELLRDLN
jgi:ATP-binding cassette subfamily B protein